MCQGVSDEQHMSLFVVTDCSCCIVMTDEANHHRAERSTFLSDLDP